MAYPTVPQVAAVAALVAPVVPLNCSHLTVNAGNVVAAIDYYIDPVGSVAANGAVDWAKTKIMRQSILIKTDQTQRQIPAGPPPGNLHRANNVYNATRAPVAHHPWA